MFKNMKIGKRLILVFAIVVVISSFATGWCTYLLNQTDNSYSEALVKYGFAQGDVGDLGKNFQEQRAVTLYIAALDDGEARTSMINELTTVDESVVADLAKIKVNLLNAQEEAVFAQIEKAWGEYKVLRDQAIEFSNTPANRGDASIQKVMTLCYDQSAILSESIKSLTEEKLLIGNERSAELSAQSNLFMFIMIAAIIIVIIIAMTFAIIISKGISKPVTEMENAARKLANGDLSAYVDYKSKDELGGLAEGVVALVGTVKAIIEDEDYLLGEMANGNFDIESKAEESYVGDFSSILKSLKGINFNLSDTLSQINRSADQVSAGSDQVSSGAQALSQGATEQASSVQELSATINEISEKVRQNADNAQNARNQSSKAGDGVELSNRHMQEMIAAMTDISNKSTEIGKIIKTIDDIAFQTNILALNAAVEAARAGVAGKGFAVVASEVRSLAGKSAEAAKNTTGLIEDTVAAVENGTRIAGETAKAMLGVVNDTNIVTGLIAEIADASNEQSTSISQITTGIDQISSVVQTNSATAEESAAASEELSGQAQMLKEMISKFTLRDSGNAAKSPAASVESVQPEHEYSPPTSYTSYGGDKY